MVNRQVFLILSSSPSPGSILSVIMQTILRTFCCVIACALTVTGQETFYKLDDYDQVEKIDSHFHIRTVEPTFVKLAAQDQFKFLNVVVHTTNPIELKQKHQASFAQKEAHPGHVEVASAFPLEGWDDVDWIEKTIQYLEATFRNGAVAVKVWKDIGMEFRDKDGKLVMIDDPQFDPVFDYLEQKGIRLMGHLGEPKNCWLPLDDMTVKNDRNYFRRNPKYHMYLHPEMPSYEDQINARNRMLDKHPKLLFIGAHFGSLEWSVDELGKFLDKYPKAVVDTAARMGQIQYQSNLDLQRVRNFFIKYQDRIVYGTDGGVTAPGQAKAAYYQMQQRWISDWAYLCTDEEQSVAVLDLPVKGLKLTRTVIDKIYRKNIKRVFPNSWQASTK